MDNLMFEVKDFFFNPNFNEKLIVRSNYVTPSICVVYYIMASYAGPYLMKDRKPFSLKYTLIFYNFLMVILNLIVMLGFASALMTMESLCPPDLEAVIRETVEVLKPYAWLFVLLKYAEFLDSAFFVLRKRFDLLTVLHRSHHALVPLFGLYFLRNLGGLCLLFGLTVNSGIHVVMYFYYGLAAFGPELQKYLWWKKYITIIQITQFAAVMSCVSISAVTRCSVTEKQDTAIFLFAFPFLILFINYFIHEIKKTGKTGKRMD